MVLSHGQTNEQTNERGLHVRRSVPPPLNGRERQKANKLVLYKEIVAVGSDVRPTRDTRVLF